MKQSPQEPGDDKMTYMYPVGSGFGNGDGYGNSLGYGFGNGYGDGFGFGYGDGFGFGDGTISTSTRRPE